MIIKHRSPISYDVFFVLQVLTPNVPDIMVIPPEDDHLRHVIDTMALCVLDGGCAFEQAIMERGRGNPLFSFLFELGSMEHTYYVWRLYSFAQVICCCSKVWMNVTAIISSC